MDSRHHCDVGNVCSTGRYHSDSLQVDLGAAELLPAVMFVTLSLRDAAELACRLEDVFHQGTTTHLVCQDLTARQAERQGSRVKGRKRDKETGRKTDRGTVRETRRRTKRQAEK